MTEHSVHTHAVLSQHKWSWTLLRSRKDTTSAEIEENQLYAEIKDPESLEHPSTSSEVVRVAPDPTPTGPTSHHYDNVVLAGPSGDYQLHDIVCSIWSTLNT